MPDIIIQFENVSFAYEHSTPLFKGVTMGFERGRFYLIAGPSGSGKSTFLRLINRLEEPASGEIRFKTHAVSNVDPTALRSSILYVQQVPQVIDTSVRDNLMLPFTFKGNRDLPRPDDRRLKTLMHQLLLEDVRLDDPAKTLSIGQQQRVCFIRALLLSPEVLLLDEPTSALDKDSSRIVQAIAHNLCREKGVTVLMVSHRDMETCSLESVCLRVGNGRVTPMEAAQ